MPSMSTSSTIRNKKIAKTEITNEPKKPKIILRFVKRSTLKTSSK